MKLTKNIGTADAVLWGIRPVHRTINFSDTLSLCGKRSGTKVLKYST